MTESDAQIAAALDRDDKACVRCQRGKPDDVDLSVTAVGPASEDGPVSAQLATVCGPCQARIEGVVPSWTVGDPAAAIGTYLQELTSAQGELVGTVASLASTTTDDPHPDDRTWASTYLADRRRSWIGLAYVDRTVDLAEHVEPTDGPPSPSADADAEASVGNDLQALRERVASLQDDLATIVQLSETAVTATGHCHVCLTALPAEGPCVDCETPRRETEHWDRDGTLAESALYGTIDDRLRSAGETTDSLVERSGDLAERVLGPSG